MGDDPLTEPAATMIPTLALRPHAAAQALGVSDRTLWAWTQAGDVPHVKRNGTILYPVDSLRAWLVGQVTAGKGAVMR